MAKVRCSDCMYCYVEEMKCRPESKDCEKEYILTEEDLKTYSNCDFYKSK